MSCDLEVIRLRNNSSAILVMSSDQHYSGVIMCAMTAQIIGASIIYWTVCSGISKKHQSSVSLAFVRGIRRWPVNSRHKGPVTRNMVSFDDVTLAKYIQCHNMGRNYGRHFLSFVVFLYIFLICNMSLIALPCWAHWWSHKCTTAVSEAWVLAIYVSS